MKKIICINVMCFMSIAIGYAQSGNSLARKMPNEDSLLTILNSPGEDSGKVKAYHMLGALSAGTNAQAAITYSKKGIEMARKINYKRGMASCLYNASYCYGLLNNLEKAVLYIDSTIQVYRETNRVERLGSCYKMRAEYRQKQGKLRLCLNDCDSAMAYAERSKNHVAKIVLYKIMANVYYDQGNYDQSKFYFEKAYDEHAKISDSIPMTDIMNRLGNIAHKKKEYNTSIALYTKAIDWALKNSQENNISEYYNSLARVYIDKDDKVRGEINAKKALSYARTKKNERQLAAAQNTLSALYLNNDSTSAAITAATAGYSLSNNIGSAETKQAAADALAYGYHKAGDYKQAFHYLEISKALTDSMAYEKYDRELSTIQTAFKVNEKDREIMLLNKEKALQLSEIKQQRLLIAAAVAIAILSLTGIGLFRNRNRLRQQMQELELRHQIAADLHDEVGSSLSSIHMLSQMAVQPGNEKSHADILARMSTNAKETMDKVGDIVWMIKPGETESGSLKQRMERFAYEMCSSKNIEVKLNIDDLDKLKPAMDQRKNIYLIFKEALNNAVKYSGAEKIAINVAVQAGKLLMDIKDFGKGFDTGGNQKGNGLQNMQHRSQDLKGSLSIRSVQNEGTTVSLSMPV
ncbi:MAG: hypothetical protein EOO13_04830 [Chitinophagaceae bacterium]|nr:MAG: hypothetical protein EOO13_04830 [Chitinophagaceae bacterium]